MSHYRATPYKNLQCPAVRMIKSKWFYGKGQSAVSGSAVTSTARGIVTGCIILVALMASIYRAEAQAAAGQSSVEIGPWIVITQKDRFGGNDAVVASQIAGLFSFGVRCLSDKDFSLSIVELQFGTGRLTRSMAVSALIRVDEHPPERVSAAVVNDKLIQLNFPLEKADQLLRGKEVAIRLVIDGAQRDHIFSLLQSQRALMPVLRACRAR